MLGRYSRGIKQRLQVARGLLTSPEVLFLDEPTIGIDPLGARAFRRIVPELGTEEVTILLTTHYMFEADSLCDRVALIDRGRLVAEGTPTDIKREFSQIREMEITLNEVLPGLEDQVSALPGANRIDLLMDGLRQKANRHNRPGFGATGALTNPGDCRGRGIGWPRNSGPYLGGSLPEHSRIAAGLLAPT